MRTTQTVSVVIRVVLLQIRFQPNDHKTIKETADELKIFEGIKHPNLVRYFGVELHRVSSPRGTEHSNCLLSEIKSQTVVVGPASRALPAILAGRLLTYPSWQPLCRLPLRDTRCSLILMGLHGVGRKLRAPCAEQWHRE